MPGLPDKGLYAITDSQYLDPDKRLLLTDMILARGVALLQYRNKTGGHDLKVYEAVQLQKLCKKYSVPFIINDDVELAIELNADGVHLGKNDQDCSRARILLGSQKIIGVSCYDNIDIAIAAREAGASYVAFGAFAPTGSKPGTVQADIITLTHASNILDLPVVAIGGITPENGKKLLEAGADFLAVISGLYCADNTEFALDRYMKLFKT